MNTSILFLFSYFDKSLIFQQAYMHSCISRSLFHTLVFFTLFDSEFFIPDLQNDRHLRATCRLRRISMMLFKARLASREALVNLAHDLDLQNDRYLRATCRFRLISMMLCKARLVLFEAWVNLAHDSDIVSNISQFKENHFLSSINRVIMPYIETLYTY